jgi:hypothetical protein
MSVSEWDGSQGKYVSGAGIISAAGGLAVTEITDGVGSLVTKDGKPVGSRIFGQSANQRTSASSLRPSTVS